MTSMIVPEEQTNEALDDDIEVIGDTSLPATTDVKPGRLARLVRPERKTVNALKLAIEGDPHVVSYELAEQMRLLVVRSQLDRGIDSLALSAAVPGEGTSFIARSLAAVLAHDTDRAVCLVEFDWESRGSGERVSEVAVDGIGRNREYKTGRKVSIINSGYVAPLQRSPFVAADSLRSDIEALKDYFDLVIFDLPAVSTHTGVLGLSQFADRYAIVARQGVSPMADIRAAVADLGEERLAGIVLNQTKFSTPKWINRLFGAAS